MANKKTGRSGTFWKVFGTIVLICILAALLFTCIFAVYIKTCIIPTSQLDLEDFTLNQSSTIWYQDANGEWKELVTLSGSEKRKWWTLRISPTTWSMLLWQSRISGSIPTTVLTGYARARLL